MSKISTLAKSAAAAALIGVVGMAQATPIVGIVNTTNSQVKIGVGYIDWNNDPVNLNPPPNGANTTVGEFNVINLRTGSFLGVPLFSTGQIRDMADPSVYPGDTGNAFPLNTLTSVANFLTFAAKPAWSFTATFLAPGSLAGTPYSLVQIGNNVTVSMSVNGIACDMGVNMVCDAGDDKTKWTGVFSAQYTNTTIAGLMAKVFAGTVENNAWSGTIEASKIPEPTALALAGLALAGAGVAARRGRKSKAA